MPIRMDAKESIKNGGALAMVMFGHLQDMGKENSIKIKSFAQATLLRINIFCDKGILHQEEARYANSQYSLRKIMHFSPTDLTFFAPPNISSLLGFS